MRQVKLEELEPHGFLQENLLEGSGFCFILKGSSCPFTSASSLGPYSAWSAVTS